MSQQAGSGHPGATHPPGLDLDRLRDYLDRAHPGLVDGPLAAELISGGKSNLTYRLHDSAHRWVVRRPPLGHVLATAHDMGREHRVISALAGTGVPVPGAHLLCTDPDVLGAPFYVMDEVRGSVYRNAEDVAGIGRERARTMSFRLIDVLAELHGIDPATVGLSDFGRPDGYLQRQLDRWLRQFEASRSREIDGMAELQHRLAEHLPQTQRHTVVHGDYRLDNAIIADDDSVAAVLDWEMATLGDSLTDLGLLGLYWNINNLPDVPSGVVPSSVSVEDGYPSFEQLVDEYAETAGVTVPELPWYLALAAFKLAVILEGIHFRFQAGQTVGAGFDQIGRLVTPLALAGRRFLQGV